MDAEGGNRSLSAGISIPQWMKGRMDARLDFDEATFSPPENDDSFLYIRYPEVTKKLKSPAGVRKNSNTPSSIKVGPQLDTAAINHTVPCKQYILKPGYHPTVTVAAKPKSNGTDDGFKGEGAACGSSVIRVAHQMVSGKLSSASPMDEDPLRPKGFDPTKRRGSKSLPASPQGSPTSRRRMITNKYFTGAFVDNENHGGSWILQGLLSNKRDMSQSISYIAEEGTNKAELLEKAISDLRISEPPKPDKKIAAAAAAAKGFKPKPSEFREMNFWSPTSM